VGWLAAVAMLVAATPLAACPFCTALKPSLAQLREQADVVALAEVQAQDAGNRAALVLHTVLQGSERLDRADRLDAVLDAAVKPGALILVFGTRGEGSSGWSWHVVPVDETGYAYFARSPSLKQPTARRLTYFAPFLEHANPLVAEDAYLEFGHAAFDEVARVADGLSIERLKAWLLEERVPPHRKGFYGLAIGLRATGERRPEVAEFLRKCVLAPDDDFRAGFDGVLGGYLLAAGPAGLDLVESRYLANAQAADGDVRHAMTALRFYFEYGREISPERLSAALACLLARCEFAEAAIIDLGRWKAWHTLDRVVAVYSRADSDERTRRAVVGYLLACPNAEAREALARLRQIDPQGVAAAEQRLSITSSVPAVE
jgi:hypothetical protein